MTLNRKVCYFTGKLSHESYDVAMARLAECVRRREAGDLQRQEQRAYLCPCGGWHLSRSTGAQACGRVGA